MIILMVAATLSIVLSLTVGHAEDMEYIDGIAILVAVAIVVLVGSINDYSKEL